MQFDIPQYSLKVMTLATDLKCLSLPEIEQKERHSNTHLSLGCLENFYDSWFSHIYVFLISCNTNQK